MPTVVFAGSEIGDEVPGFGEIVTLVTGVLRSRNSIASVRAATFAISVLAVSLVGTAMYVQPDTPWPELKLISAAQRILLAFDVPDTSGFEAVVSWLERDQLMVLALAACAVAACAAVRWKLGGIATAWTLIALAGVNLGWGPALLVGLIIHSIVYIVIVLVTLAERIETRSDPWHEDHWQGLGRTIARWASELLVFVFFPLWWLGHILNGIANQFVLEPLPRSLPTGA